MSWLDVSNAEDQKEYAQGPIPSGSIVIVKTELVVKEDANYGAGYIWQAQSGLKGLMMKFTVAKGTYEGLQFSQWITLPASKQSVSLDPKKEQACAIGASQIKAMLLAAGKPTQLQGPEYLIGLRIPIKVSVEAYRSKKDDAIYHNNRMSKIITPDMPEYMQMKQVAEIINEGGAVEGKLKEKPRNDSYNYSNTNSYDYNTSGSEQVDSVPF